MKSNWPVATESEIRLCKAVGKTFSLGDIVLDADSQQFGIVDAIRMPFLSFHTNPLKTRPKQIRARIVDCLYMGSLYQDAWKALADYGIRDPRITLNAAHKWIDCYRAVLNVNYDYSKVESNANMRRLYYTLERFYKLTSECKAAGLWDDTLQGLFDFTSGIRQTMNNIENADRYDDVDSIEYWMREQDTF